MVKPRSSFSWALLAWPWPAVAWADVPAGSAVVPPASAEPIAQPAPEPAGPEANGPAAEARTAFEQGLTALRAEQWATAETAFRRSLALVPRQSTQYDLALVLFKQGRLRESLVLLQELLKSEGADASYREYAEALIPHVVTDLATVRLAVRPPEARVTLDGDPLQPSGGPRSILVDPGPHRIGVSAAGYVDQTVELVANAGAELQESIELVRPVQLAPPPAHRPEEASFVSTVGPWITMGLGGALLVGGAVTGILAKRADQRFVEGCPSLNDCNPSLRGTRDDAEHLGHVADALFVAGGVLVAGGVTWRLLAPPTPRTQAVFLSVSARF